MAVRIELLVNGAILYRAVAENDSGTDIRMTTWKESGKFESLLNGAQCTQADVYRKACIKGDSIRAESGGNILYEVKTTVGETQDIEELK